MSNDWKTCWRCTVKKSSGEFLSEADYECILCRTRHVDEKAKPIFAVTAGLIFRAPKQKRIEMKS